MKEQYFTQLKSNFDKGIEIMHAKNHDYAQDHDPFSNFKNSAMLTEIPVERQLLYEMTKKISRVSNLLGKSNAVADEKVEDTLLDLANYANILLTYLQTK